MAFLPTDWLDWTTAEYEVGAPATSLSFERWFRNPVALAQGAPNAPRIEVAAMADWLYTAGGVGTYAFAKTYYGGAVAFGSTVPGAGLTPIFALADNTSTPTLSGTWRCMGQSFGTNNGTRTTLWIRIA